MDYYILESEEKGKLAEGFRQIPVQVDQRLAMNLVTKQIYKNSNAGFRELYANAVRACLEAKQKYNANPRIEITIDPITLDFTMIEYDSTGITKDIFENIVCVVGRSGNFDGTLPGQFGIGLCSYYALSDNILIESLARDDEYIAYIGREMKVFDDISSANKSKSTLTTYGTKINLKMQHLEENMDMEMTPGHSNYHLLSPVIEYLKGIARFSGVATDLIITNNVSEDWTGERGKIRISCDNPKALLGPDYTDDDFIEIHTDDYDLIATNGSVEIAATTLAGMPIANDLILEEHFDSYWFNVKNERDYMPTVSRDTFTAVAIRDLNAKLSQDLLDYVAEKYAHLDSIEKWINLDNMRMEIFLVNCHEYLNFDNSDKLEKLTYLINVVNGRCEIFGKSFHKRGTIYSVFRYFKHHKITKVTCLKENDSSHIKRLKSKGYTVIVINDRNAYEFLTEQYFPKASSL